MIRNIITIDQEKCVGCGICANACHQSAIVIVDGKAKLSSDDFCDGLGRCLPTCPVGAIELIEKDVPAFSNKPKKIETKPEIQNQAKNAESEPKPMACGCPSSMERSFSRSETPQAKNEIKEENQSVNSQLNGWPVQLSLLNPASPSFDDCNLLVAADCVAYAYGNFHNEFIKGHTVAIGCPKLDDIDNYKNKLATIMSLHNIKSVTVVRMEVPCCGGIVKAVRQAVFESGSNCTYKEVNISVEGSII